MKAGYSDIILGTGILHNGGVAKVVFLGYIVLAQGLRVDQSKIEIKTWHVPPCMHDVRSFNGLASFYKRFIHHFSTLAIHMTEALKATKFVWTPQDKKSFEELKDKLTCASVLALVGFDKVFEVECNAFGVGISAVLIQEGRPLAYFSEKLSYSSGDI